MSLLEKHLSHVVMQLDGMAFVLDRQGRFTGIWGKGLEKHGLSEADFVGQFVPTTFSSSTQRLHEKAFSMALLGHETLYHWYLSTPKGVTHFQTTLTPMTTETGDVQGVTGVISETSHWDSIHSLGPTQVSFVASGMSGKPPVFISESIKEYGYSPEDLYTRTVRYSDLIHPDDWLGVLATLGTAMTERRDHLIQEFRILQANGQITWVRATIYFQYPQGEPPLLEGVLQDISLCRQTDAAVGVLRATLDSFASHIAILDHNGEILYTNQAWAEFAIANNLGGHPDCIGLNYLEVCDQTPEVLEGIRSVITGKSNSFTQEYPCHSPTSKRWYCLRVTPFQGPGPMRVVVSHSEITDRYLAEQRLKQLASEQDTLLNNIETQIWYLKNPHTYGAVNEARARFSGRTREEYENRSIYEVVPPEAADTWVAQNQISFESKQRTYVEKWFTNAQGQERLLAITKTPKINEAGVVEFLVCTAVDITEKWESQDRLHYLSYRDKLTGLYNRAFCDEELTRLDRSETLPLSIIMGDVNGLKLVNDGFGHHSGDDLLVRMAQVVQASVRKGDIVSRWGGDEFVILLPQTSGEEAQKVKDQIREALQRASVEGMELELAMGIATKIVPSQSMAEVLREAEDRMYRNKLAMNNGTRSALIQSLAQILAEKSWETESHAQRIRNLVIPLARQMGLPDSKIDELALLASLHDIGKVAIPESIINKPGSLTPQEWEILKKHSEIGFRIASSTPALAPIAQAILCHHEWWNGTGYPQGLREEEIPITSRILAIVDAFDAMTHSRPYRSPVSPDEALAELEHCAGTQFDPQIAQLFIAWMRSENSSPAE